MNKLLFRRIITVILQIMNELLFSKLNWSSGSRVKLQRTTRSCRAHWHDQISNTSQHLQQGLTNPEYTMYSARLTRLKGKTPRIWWLKGIGKARKGELLQKYDYNWVLTFKVLARYYFTSRIHFAPELFSSNSITCNASHFNFPFHFHSHHVP